VRRRPRSSAREKRCCLISRARCVARFAKSCSISQNDTTSWLAAKRLRKVIERLQSAPHRAAPPQQGSAALRSQARNRRVSRRHPTPTSPNPRHVGHPIFVTSPSKIPRHRGFPCKDRNSSVYLCGRLPWFVCVPQLTRAPDLLSVPYRDLTRPPVLDGGRVALKDIRLLTEQ
jgi:hypothetical protein